MGNKTTVNLRGTYTSMTDKVRPNATVLTSFKTRDDQFGFLVGAQYWAKSVRNDRFYNTGWNLNKFVQPANPVAGAEYLPAGYYTPTRTRPTIETEDRTRLSGLISAQWRPSDELETTLDVSLTRLDVEYDEFGLDIYPDDPGTYLVPGSVALDGNTVTKATINNVRFMASREYSLNRHDLINVGLKQVWNPGDWHVSANANWSYAQADAFPTDYRIRPAWVWSSPPRRRPPPAPVLSLD